MESEENDLKECFKRNQFKHVDYKFNGTELEYNNLLKTSKTLYVSNIPKNVREERLWHLFSIYGKIKELHMGINFGGEFLGFIFIVYSTQEEAEISLKNLNFYKIDENTLKIDRDRGYFEDRRFGMGNNGNRYTNKPAIVKRRKY
ncbi:NCBP2 [Hepatospora eriocheir]|uniref:Nuclear cap-binding protein subunit 2 n=1 Tax=Hepatospora eriocheir TaxID=1081669 RepID=A0A1X0Q856_9MICR|nr:NCBP2 [Hepatospora eriocheir]